MLLQVSVEFLHKIILNIFRGVSFAKDWETWSRSPSPREAVKRSGGLFDVQRHSEEMD